MPVSDLADPEGCHLYLWATNNYLPAAFECIKAWGFEYITTITWMKDKVGLGQYYRGITEHCLFATTKKRLPYKIDGDKRGQIAFKQLGIEVNRYISYEIDKYAISVTQLNFPHTEQCGDVFAADFTQYQNIDWLIGGSPCTHWSIAQKNNRETQPNSGMG